jgi:hypothetical protein
VRRWRIHCKDSSNKERGGRNVGMNGKLIRIDENLSPLSHPHPGGMRKEFVSISASLPHTNPSVTLTVSRGLGEREREGTIELPTNRIALQQPDGWY